MLKEGMRAPDFCLQGIDEQGTEKEVCLSDVLNRGKDVVLYVYAKDNTPGCTQEACDFRDNFSRITKRAEVIGISRDSIASHKKFKEKNSLNFPLLSDPDHQVLSEYGAWGEKKMYGKTMMGAIRSTYLIGSNGVVKKVWPKVKVKGHVEEVLKEL